jgi:hypothetical protein
MKNNKRKVIGLVLASMGVLFAANAIVAGPRAFGCGMPAVVGSICAGAALLVCGAAMLLQNDSA